MCVDLSLGFLFCSKPKAKHPKTHIDQINKDQTQRTNIKSSKGKTTNTPVFLDFPGSSDYKEPASNVGDLGSIPGLRRSPGGRHGNPLQYCCLENPMDRGAWWARVHGITKNRTQLSDDSTTSESDSRTPQH